MSVIWPNLFRDLPVVIASDRHNEEIYQDMNARRDQKSSNATQAAYDDVGRRNLQTTLLTWIFYNASWHFLSGSSRGQLVSASMAPNYDR